MITICEFGTTPAQAALGFKIQELFVGTDAEAIAEFDARAIGDVRLVRGPSIFGQPDKCEFAVMTRRDSLWFRDHPTAERFAAAVVASGFEATVEVDTDADLDDPHTISVTYSGAEVTEFSQTPYSALGRMSLRFSCE
jgi:hypothetical protein